MYNKLLNDYSHLLSYYFICLRVFLLLFFLALLMCLFPDTITNWGKSEERNIYKLSKCFLLSDLLLAKDKIVTFQWRNPVNTLLIKHSKSASPRRTNHHVPLDVMRWGPPITRVIFLTKLCHLNLFVRKFQTHLSNNNWLILFRQCQSHERQVMKGD